VDLDEDFVLPGHRPCDLLDAEYVGRAIPVVDHRSHAFSSRFSGGCRTVEAFYNSIMRHSIIHELDKIQTQFRSDVSHVSTFHREGTAGGVTHQRIEERASQMSDWVAGLKRPMQLHQEEPWRPIERTA
jgi:hypothetical protein